MRNAVTVRLILSTCLLLPAGTHAAATCQLEALAPSGGQLTLPSHTVSLGEADARRAPDAWQGPLQSGACTLDLGIIERPMSRADDGLLYVTTYSGSLRQVALVDLSSCRVSWKSRKFAGDVAFGASAIKMGAKSVRLGKDCLPGRGKQ